MDKDSDQSTHGKTLIAVAGIVLAVLLLPVGVQAVTNAVHISDPVHPSSMARVVSGKLEVGDGSGALTVNGTVSAQPSGPKKPLTGYVLLHTTNKYQSLFGPTSSKNTFK